MENHGDGGAYNYHFSQTVNDMMCHVWYVLLVEVLDMIQLNNKIS